MQLVGNGNVYNGKNYGLNDSVSSIVPSALGFNDEWYGGMVKRMYLTSDGVYLCCDGRENIVNILVPDELPEKQEQQQEQQQEQKQDDVKTDKVDRKKLLELAEKLGVEGKYALMKNVDLIALIKEKGGDIDGLQEEKEKVSE